MYPNLNQVVNNQPQAGVVVVQPEREWTHR